MKQHRKQTLSTAVHTVLFILAVAYVVFGIYTAGWGLAVVGIVLLPLVCLSAYLYKHDKRLVIYISMEDDK